MDKKFDPFYQSYEKPITKVFAYRTGTFNRELPEVNFEPIPKRPYGGLGWAVLRFMFPSHFNIYNSPSEGV
ncbi:MAG: hypothetical protein WC533_03010 [Candidatus Pacearchaeota archaeon]